MLKKKVAREELGGWDRSIDKFLNSELQFSSKQETKPEVDQSKHPFFVSKRAFQKKQEADLQKSRALIFSREPRQTPPKNTKNMKNTKNTKRFHDRMTLETIIQQRNEEYQRDIETLPEGYRFDIEKRRKLPPERKF